MTRRPVQSHSRVRKAEIASLPAGLMQPRGMLLATLVLTAITLAGCTGSGPSDDFVTPDQDDEGRYVIRMTSALRFVPEKAEVPLGATVVWVHEGGGLHDTRADDGLWESALLDEGEEFDFMFDEAGDFAYSCKPHRASGMTGIIRVA